MPYFWKSVKVIFFIPLVLGVVVVASGQDITTAPHPEFCKPGVVNQSKGKGLLIEFGERFTDDQRPEMGEDEDEAKFFELFRLKMKLPLYYSKGLVVLAGVNHLRERYHFQNFLPGTEELSSIPIENRLLIRSGLNLNVLKPLDDKHYLAFRAEYNSNGDYTQLINFDKNYRSIKGAALLGIKKRQDLEMAFGIGFSQGIRRTSVYPFMIYNRTFNQKWGVEAILPVKVNVRYNISPTNTLLFGPAFNSREYFISLDNPVSGNTDNFRMTRQELRLEVAYEQHITSWVFFSAKVGYNYALRHRFESMSGNFEDVNISPDNGPYFRIGFFVSPTTCK